MLQQDAPDFGDGLRILIRPMATWNDDLALGAIDVTAPVRHDAIRADWRSVVQVPTFATVGNDRVVRHAWRGRKFINSHEETVLRVERIDGIREAFELHPLGVRLADIHRLRPFLLADEHGSGAADEVAPQLAEPVGGKVGSAEGGGGKDHPRYFG